MNHSDQRLSFVPNMSYLECQSEVLISKSKNRALLFNALDGTCLRWLLWLQIKFYRFYGFLQSARSNIRQGKLQFFIEWHIACLCIVKYDKVCLRTWWHTKIIATCPSHKLYIKGLMMNHYIPTQNVSYMHYSAAYIL